MNASFLEILLLIGIVMLVWVLIGIITSVAVVLL